MDKLVAYHAAISEYVAKLYPLLREGAQAYSAVSEDIYDQVNAAAAASFATAFPPGMAPRTTIHKITNVPSA